MRSQEGTTLDVRSPQDGQPDADGAQPDSKPNFMLRRTLAVASAGVMAVGAFFGVKAAIKAHNQDTLNSELSQPLPDVAAEIRDGTIDASQVGRFKVGDTEYAWSVASDLTRHDHAGETGVIADIIQAQEGNPVQAGSTVILPKSEIDQHPQP